MTSQQAFSATQPIDLVHHLGIILAPKSYQANSKVWSVFCGSASSSSSSSTHYEHTYNSLLAEPLASWQPASGKEWNAIDDNDPNSSSSALLAASYGASAHATVPAALPSTMIKYRPDLVMCLVLWGAQHVIFDTCNRKWC